jgi:hypothetical protein
MIHIKNFELFYYYKLIFNIPICFQIIGKWPAFSFVQELASITVSLLKAFTVLGMDIYPFL